MILVHIKTRLDLLGIKTFRWDQRLGRQYSNLNRHVSTQEKQSQRQYSTSSSMVVLVAYVDRFEQSSSPPEKNIKWPKMEHKMAKNGWKPSKVAITGSTRSLLAKNGR